MANYEFKSAHIENYNKYKHISLTDSAAPLPSFVHERGFHSHMYI